jgi:hypothetical protein
MTAVAREELKAAHTALAAVERKLEIARAATGNRLINRANPKLWKAASGKQVYLTALRAHSPSSGPGLTVAGLIPDLDHYKRTSLPP